MDLWHAKPVLPHPHWYLQNRAHACLTAASQLIRHILLLTAAVPPSPLAQQVRTMQGQLLLEGIKDRPLDGYGTTGQPDGHLLEWPYEDKNALYYGRNHLALTDAEKSQQVQVSNASP